LSRARIVRRCTSEKPHDLVVVPRGAPERVEARHAQGTRQFPQMAIGHEPRIAQRHRPHPQHRRDV
jgi:hypothetical protein